MSKPKNMITWFKRDELGRWQWQGFETQLQGEEAITSWFDELVKRYGDDAPDSPEIFVIDLEHLDELAAASTEVADAQQELDLLRGWLDEVVRIDKITVEEEFSEYCKRKQQETQEVPS